MYKVKKKKNMELTFYIIILLHKVFARQFVFTNNKIKLYKNVFNKNVLSFPLPAK